MSSLSDLLSVAINAIFIFATVGFVAQATTEAISDALQWRENLLLSGVKELLNDPTFEGLARRIYTNPGVNPRVNPDVQSQAQLNVKPKTIDPKAFAVVLLEVLHIVPSAPYADEPRETFRAVEENIPVRDRVANATANAEDVIRYLVSNEVGQAELIKLVQNMLIRHGAVRADMETAVAAWFEIGMAHVVNDFRRWTRLSNCLVAFVLAAALGLQPIPLGGFLTSSKPPSVVLLNKIGNEYVIAGFQWILVALSTLAGAEFWFAILKKVAAPASGGTAQSPVPGPAAGPPAGGTPGPSGAGPSPAGGTPGPSGGTPSTPGGGPTPSGSAPSPPGAPTGRPETEPAPAASEQHLAGTVASATTVGPPATTPSPATPTAPQQSSLSGGPVGAPNPRLASGT